MEDFSDPTVCVWLSHWGLISPGLLTLQEAATKSWGYVFLPPVARWSLISIQEGEGISELRWISAR